jgi:tetrahydromethanopterin S-methyltransferase subunit D
MIQLDPANQGAMTDLSWIPIEVWDTEFSVADGTYSFTVPNVNLIEGVDNPVVGGQQVNYYMYVAFLDGAGNATVQAIESPAVPLSEDATLPSVTLPLVQR